MYISRGLGALQEPFWAPAWGVGKQKGTFQAPAILWCGKGEWGRRPLDVLLVVIFIRAHKFFQ